MDPDQTTPRGAVSPAKYLLPCCCICDSILIDMQFGHVQKKLNFDLLTANPGWGRGSVGKILATVLVHS